MATKALKYMLMSKVIVDWLHGVTWCCAFLCASSRFLGNLKFFNPAQVMLNLPDEVTNLVSGKLALRCLGSLLTPDSSTSTTPLQLTCCTPHQHCTAPVSFLTSSDYMQ